MLNFGEDLKKLFLLGVGAVATTAEKSKEIVDELVKKGELTVEQGKALNDELKRTIREKTKSASTENSDMNIVNKLDNMNDEEIQAIKAKLAEIENMKISKG